MTVSNKNIFTFIYLKRIYLIPLVWSKFTGLHLGLHQSRQIAVYTKKKAAIFLDNCLILSDPLGARTQDPNIKSVVLYLLS